MTDERSGRRPDPMPTHEILRVLVGSYAYGTATEESDRDERAVFVVPTPALLTVNASGRNRVKDTLWVEGVKEGEDLTGWEAQKFLQLALHCNPNALEVLWAPTLLSNHWGVLLRTLRHSFLSRRTAYEAYRGYSRNQQKKMLWEPEVGWTRRNWKFAESYLRVLQQGIDLLVDGDLTIAMELYHPYFHEALVRAKRGEMPIEEVTQRAREREEELFRAYEHSKLPEEPDILPINDWLLELRQAYWPAKEEVTENGQL